jgi:hypothetical protein
MPTQLDDAGLSAFIAGLPDAVDEGADEAAGFIVDLGRQLAPVLTGDFKGSIKKKPGEQQGERKVVAGGETAPHGVIVEYGDPSNPNYPAQPTLGPAADAIDVGLAIKGKLVDLARRSAR